MERDASDSDLKKAYRQLALKYHPGRHIWQISFQYYAHRSGMRAVPEMKKRRLEITGVHVIESEQEGTAHVIEGEQEGHLSVLPFSLFSCSLCSHVLSVLMFSLFSCSLCSHVLSVLLFSLFS